MKMTPIIAALLATGVAHALLKRTKPLVPRGRVGEC